MGSKGIGEMKSKLKVLRKPTLATFSPFSSPRKLSDTLFNAYGVVIRF